MKVKFFLIFILCLSVLFSGCSSNPADKGINFYYCQNKIDYDAPQGTIGSEFRKEPIDPLAYNELLNQYLKGPKSSGLISPFPADIYLVSFALEQQTAIIVLSDHIAELNGVDLSIACTCLSLTVKDLTGCATVQIRAQNKLLDNKQSVTINTNAIFLSELTP